MSSLEIQAYIKSDMAECANLYGALTRKWSDIYAAACEVERRFEKRPGARNDINELHVAGWEEFLEECGIKPATFRKWRQRSAAAMKPLESFVDPPELNGPKPRPDKGKKSGCMASDAQAPRAKAAAKNLADARKQLGAAAAAGNAQAAAIIAEYEQAVTAAGSGALTNEDNSTSDCSVVIDPTESDSEGVRLTEDGSLVVTTPAPTSKVALLEGKAGFDQVRGAYAKVRSVFNRVADTAVIESALQDTLEEFILPMLDQHPYMQVDTPYRPELRISVTFKRAGRARISAGDWVDYRGGDDRLTEQIGAEAALGRVVEADAFSRPRVTWFSGTKWLKPYILFNQEAVHVLFADQAASAYPVAFSTYSEPALSKPPTAVPPMKVDASASSAPSAVAALAASAGAHGMEDARENPVLSNVVSPSPAESLAEDNLPAHSAGPVTLGFLPHGEATRTQLVPDKKYQVRPAPSGGFGIYEGRSNVPLQLFTEEDDARDAIDQLKESALVA
jgi:hypothetical protein